MRLYSYTKGKIGGRDLGLKYHPLRLATSAYFYRRSNGKYDKSTIDPDVCRQRAKSISNDPGPIVLDIEEFSPTDGWGKMQSEIRKAIEIYRGVNPHHRIGVYRIMPRRDYWTPVQYRRDPTNQFRQNFRFWSEHNMRFRTSRNDDGDVEGPIGLADLVDFVSPSLYSFYLDQTGNAVYVRNNLHQAGRYDKPIIAWLWTQFHTAARPIGKIGGEYVGDDYLRSTLATIRRMVEDEKLNLDGICFFGGDKEHLPESAVDVLADFFPTTGGDQ